MSAAADAQAAQVAKQQQPSKASHDYKGFVGGIGSGIAKLTGTTTLSLYFPLSPFYFLQSAILIPLSSRPSV